MRDDSALIVQAGELRLNASLFWVDSWAFERACADVKTLQVATTPAPSAADLTAAMQRALAFYAGPLLAGDVDLRWTATPREQFRSLLLRTLAGTSQILQKLGANEDRVLLYRQAADHDPENEALKRGLMQALKDAGRNSDEFAV